MNKSPKNFDRPWTPPGIFTHPWHTYVLIAGAILYGVIGVNSIDVRWERIVLGMVGAGGIGAALNTSFSRYEYATSGAILLIIIAIVFIAEQVSGLIRKKTA